MVQSSMEIAGDGIVEEGKGPHLSLAARTNETLIGSFSTGRKEQICLTLAA